MQVEIIKLPAKNSLYYKWLNGKHLLRAITQQVKIDSEVQIHLPSRNSYQFADPERIAGLVSPEHVECLRESNPVPPDCEYIKLL